MKRVQYRFWIVLVGLLAAVAAHAELDREAFIRLGSKVLKIEARRIQGGYSLGSGVVVEADKVVTNCHVTRESREVYVVRGEARWRATLQASDVGHDLCVLQVPGLRGEIVKLGSAAGLKVGQPVIAIGFTGGLGIQNSAGEVVSLHRLDGGNVVQSTNWFSSGASGGALFDEELRLVGILTYRLRGGAAHYFSAPAEWVTPLLSGPAAFREVAPLEARELAYWQRPVDQQPDFLQAAILERDLKWAELETLASGWSRSAADDPLPWYLRGLALTKLDRLPDAQQSFERSLAIEPAQSAAWFQLGLLYVRQGLLERARQARARLEGLKSDLALDLSKVLDKR